MKKSKSQKICQYTDTNKQNINVQNLNKQTRNFQNNSNKNNLYSHHLSKVSSKEKEIEYKK